MALPDWHYMYGEPVQHGVLRTTHSDFKVFENLGYEADGQGEHLFLNIEKDGLNTAYVAKLIARWAGVTTRDVSYAGKKDRHAITQQHFSVQLPGRESPDIALLESQQLKVLSAKRNSKKLKTGALKGNRFELIIRGLSLDSIMESRLNQIKETGVPNYFGSQRFGFNGDNLTKAQALFDGEKVKNRDLRSMYLSAARSLIFNNVVSERLNAKLDKTLLKGDVFMLYGSKASFAPDNIDDTIVERFNQRDIMLSAPLWGAGNNKVSDEAFAFEHNIVKQSVELAQGLATFGLKHERRALMLFPEHMEWEAVDGGIKLNLSLPVGCYATSVLRELAMIKDASQQTGEISP